MTTILGIDPGMTGAIAALGQAGDFDTLQVIDMPATAKDLVDALGDFTRGRTVMVFLEQAQSMPGQGVSSTFKYGVGYGTILGVLAAYGLPHRLVTPAVWKRAMGVDKDKNKTRALAQRLFPSAPLGRVRDHGRAEALLLAEYGRRQG